eukprot:gene10287-biopygen4767
MVIGLMGIWPASPLPEQSHRDGSSAKILPPNLRPHRFSPSPSCQDGVVRRVLPCQQQAAPPRYPSHKNAHNPRHARAMPAPCPRHARASVLRPLPGIRPRPVTELDRRLPVVLAAAGDILPRGNSHVF